MNCRLRFYLLGGLTAICLIASNLNVAQADRPIKNPKFIPDAERIELFDGLDDGRIAANVIMKDANGGNVLFENKTDKPLTVQLPEALIGVQVFGQCACAGCAGCTAGGGAQAAGGGLGGGGGGGFGGGGAGGGGGGGFFSIPPQKRVVVPFHCVCLEHGKPDPKPKMKYALRRVEEFSDDPELHELLKLVGTGKINPQIAQAAAWNIASDMSWRELAMKKVDRLGGTPSTPYFSRANLLKAQQLVAFTEGRVRERDENTDADRDTPARVLRSGRTR